MNIYQSTEVRPYVYICTHKITDEFYIGSRCYNIKLNVVSHLDFPNYKTSSKTVKSNFDDYNWIIFAEFFNDKDAYDCEQQLIFENWNNPLLLNKMCHYGKNRFKPIVAYQHTEETKAKISAANKGKSKIRTPEHAIKLSSAISKSNSTRIVTPESNKKRSETMKLRRAENAEWNTRTGMTHSIEAKQKISAANKGKKRRPRSTSSL